MIKTVSLELASRPSVPTNAIVRGRTSAAAILTATTVVMVVGIGVALGGTGFILAALPLPLPLAVLWMSSDVVRADERGPGAR